MTTSAFHWVFHEHRDGEWAIFRVCGIEARVQDCDGDYSLWSVKRGPIVIAEGNERDFLSALAAAETALRAHVRAQIEKAVG